MPQYRIADDDLNDLLAYLKRLGNQPVPGITETTIRVGTITPDTGLLAEIGNGVQKLLRVAFDRINRNGGIFGRNLELTVWPTTDAFLADLDRAPPFCLIAGLGIDFESVSYRKLAESGLTTIAPIALAVESHAQALENVFFVHSSIDDQARVLVDFAKDGAVTRGRSAALLFVDDLPGRSAAQRVRSQSRTLGVSLAIDQVLSGERYSGKDFWGDIASKNVGTVFFFGDGTLLRTFLVARPVSAKPITLFSSADMVGYDARIYDGSTVTAVYLSSSTVTAALDQQRFPPFETVIQEARLTSRHRAILATAFTGVRVLEATLMQAGRALTRRKMRQQLEKTNTLVTGVTPPISFDLNRHIGHNKVTIFQVNPADPSNLIPVRNLVEPR
jgi:ABC-type branched-subunit amino acid transport system substrate-binding protein